jgi:hypothetical protein
MWPERLIAIEQGKRWKIGHDGLASTSRKLLGRKDAS